MIGAYNVQHVYISHTTHECTILTRARIFKIYHVCIRTYERTTCAFIYRKKNIRWMVAVFNRVSLSLCLSLFFLLVRVSRARFTSFRWKLVEVEMEIHT